MLESGEDLVNHMYKFGFRSDDLSWLVPRSEERNSTFKLRGISIAGKLTHRLVGYTLSKDSNVLLVSNYANQNRDELLQEYGEVLYQENLFVISWNWKWLFRSQEGRVIIAKLFHSNYQEIYHERELVQIQYQEPSKLISILDRFSSYVIIQSEDKNLDEISTQELWLVYNFTPNIESILRKQNDIIVISCVMPKDYNRFVIHNKHRYLIIDRTVWFNEISRELYYYIKQKSYLSMDFQLNNVVNFQIKR